MDEFTVTTFKSNGIQVAVQIMTKDEIEILIPLFTPMPETFISTIKESLKRHQVISKVKYKLSTVSIGNCVILKCLVQTRFYNCTYIKLLSNSFSKVVTSIIANNLSLKSIINTNTPRSTLEVSD